MVEYYRGIKVAIEVDTNKQTHKFKLNTADFDETPSTEEIIEQISAFFERTDVV